MENNRKQIEIYVREKVNKETKEIFPTFHAKQKDGKFMEVRFTKKCGYPKIERHGYIEILLENANVSNAGLYPKLWVQKIEKSWEIDKDNGALNELF